MIYIQVRGDLVGHRAGFDDLNQGKVHLLIRGSLQIVLIFMKRIGADRTGCAVFEDHLSAFGGLRQDVFPFLQGGNFSPVHCRVLPSVGQFIKLNFNMIQ
ncbi:hypothetical protein D3C81_1723890 [compost metagenome]